MLMMRGLWPAAVKSTAGDAHDAGPEAGLQPTGWPADAHDADHGAGRDVKSAAADAYDVGLVAGCFEKCSR